jgi:hypothetical protein
MPMKRARDLSRRVDTEAHPMPLDAVADQHAY